MDAQAGGKLNRLLKMAVLAGVETAVRLHVRRGDDLDARDDSGMTPLMLAASKNKAAVCSLLLEAGADLFLRDMSGRDALDIARTNGSVQAASVLETAVAVRAAEIETDFSEATEVAVSETACTQSFPFNDISVQPEEEDSFDLSGWEAEEESVAPEGDPSLVLLAADLHRSISAHRPVDLSEDWDDIEAFLPQRSSPLPKGDDEEWLQRVREFLLLGLREGSVPETFLDDLCENRDGSFNTESERILRVVLGEIGTDTDDSIGLREGGLNPEATPDEEDVLSEAFSFIDDMSSGIGESLRHYFKDMRRGRLLTAEEEALLGRRMEEFLEAALDALAAWRGGIVSLLAAAERVRVGDAAPESVSDGVSAETGPDENGVDVDNLHGDDSPNIEDEASEGAGGISFFEALDEIAALARASGTGPATQGKLRLALARARLSRSFLLSLAENANSEDAPAAAFRSAIFGYCSARDDLALSNLRLVFSIAKRYQGKGLALEDLVQEGNLGLLKAVDRYDWRKGFRFSTYATWWIRQNVSRALADKGRTIRVPVHVSDTIHRIEREIDEIEAQTGKPASAFAVASRLGIPEKKISSLMARREEPIPVHLLDPDTMPETDCQDNIERIALAELRVLIDRVLGDLDKRTAEVLCLRFGLGADDHLTLEETGERFGVTRERIRQVESKGLRMLRHPTRRELFSSFIDHVASPKKPAEDFGDEADEPSESADFGKPEDKPVEKSTAPRKINGKQHERITKASQDKQTGIDLRINKGLDKLIGAARDLGIRVDDDRHMGGGVVFALVDHKGPQRRALARMLIAKGFAYWPGMGYRK
jgi:RNA polymerase primary sigma factor